MNNENSNPVPLSLSDVDSILAYVPHALGFTPRNSAVFLLLDGNALEATLRVGLPRNGNNDVWVADVLSLLKRVTLTKIATVVYGMQGASSSTAPHSEMVSLLAEALSTNAIDMDQAWCVSDRIWDYMNESWSPLDLDALKFHPVSVNMVTRGSAPADTAELTFTAEPWATAESVRAIAENITCEAHEYFEAWKEVLDSSDPVTLLHEDDTLSATLLASMNLRLVRDFLPVLASFGTKRFDKAFAKIIETAEAPSYMADLLLGHSTENLSWEQIDRLEVVLHNLLGVALGTPKYAFKTLLAWIQWAKGRGSVAMALLEEVVAENEYSLAELLMELLSHGNMPSWATDPARAWRAQVSY